MTEEWIQVGTVILANLTMFLWAVRQSRHDYLNCQKSIEGFRELMWQETRDFHGRVVAIEERIKG